jgi:2-amino-4-hydroxy-6-hydroxymethyldihydropteridine diphosphokinase
MTAFTEGQSDPTVQPVPASVVRQVDAADSTLHNPQRAVIALGSNLGNRLETIQGAIDALEDTPGVRVKAVSPVYETEPWGVRPDSQPSYFNAVIVLRTTLPPSSLLERAHAVEEAFHRVRDERCPRARLRPGPVERRGARGPAARSRPRGPAARRGLPGRCGAPGRPGTPAARVVVKVKTHTDRTRNRERN